MSQIGKLEHSKLYDQLARCGRKALFRVPYLQGHSQFLWRPTMEQSSNRVLLRTIEVSLRKRLVYSIRYYVKDVSTPWSLCAYLLYAVTWWLPNIPLCMFCAIRARVDWLSRLRKAETNGPLSWLIELGSQERLEKKTEKRRQRRQNRRTFRVDGGRRSEAPWQAEVQIGPKMKNHSEGAMEPAKTCSTNPSRPFCFGAWRSCR